MWSNNKVRAWRGLCCSCACGCAFVSGVSVHSAAQEIVHPEVGHEYRDEAGGHEGVVAERAAQGRDGVGMQKG